jgi:signal transduction histidine kinase
MFDITDEVMAGMRERELEINYRENLESKLKSSLAAAAIGHEINTPLSTLLLQSRQSQKKGSATPEELDVIAREAQHVLRIIEKMKVLMRNVQTEHHPVNLREVVDSALLQVKRPLQEQDIALNLRVTSGESFMITGDDAQIQIAITNLLRNAIEAITEKDRDQPREILVELSRVGDDIRLAIGDSGPGWTGAEQEELPLRTTKESGTGIGLYIVRTTARNHGARRAFGTSPLGGAEVNLTFPASA